MKVKLKLIQSLSVFSLEKKYYFENFLDQFSISNKKRTKIKKSQVHRIIETEFGIFHKKVHLQE
jgi:hypothetical protein